MVINSNVTGTGSPLEKSNSRAVPNSKTANAALNPTQSSAAPVLNSLASNAAANGVTGMDDDSDFNIQSATAQIFGQPANATLAQANLSPETVFRLLQD